MWGKLHVQYNCLRSPIRGIVRNKVAELRAVVRQMLDEGPA